MIDSSDISSCGLVCSVCAKSGDSELNKEFINYSGGLMAAFFTSTLKHLTKYEAILNNAKNHPFSTTTVEFK